MARRVLHLVDRPSEKGGAYRHLLAVVRAQAELGDEVFVGAGRCEVYACVAVPA